MKVEQIAIKRIERALENNETILDLSKIGIQEIPDKIFDLNKLVEVDFSDNQISYIPERLFSLNYLKKLNLNRNIIRTIPESINKLANLEKLLIGDNKLSSLPESLSDLKNLKTLNLSDNNFFEIPGQIKELTNVEMLYIGVNNLSQMPYFLKYLTKLSSLWLNHNLITEIPDFLQDLPNLREVYLHYNKIKKIPTFVRSSNFNTLDLKGNPCFVDLDNTQGKIVFNEPIITKADIEKYKRMIASFNLEDVISELLNKLMLEDKQKIIDEVIQVSNKWNMLNKQHRLGLIDYEIFSTQASKVSYSLIGIVSIISSRL